MTNTHTHTRARTLLIMKVRQQSEKVKSRAPELPRHVCTVLQWARCSSWSANKGLQHVVRERERGGGREREKENSNSKTLFYKDCSSGSVKNLTTSPCQATKSKRERERWWYKICQCEGTRRCWSVSESRSVSPLTRSGVLSVSDLQYRELCT